MHKRDLFDGERTVNRLKRFAKRTLQRYPAVWDPIRTVRFFRQCHAKFGKFQREFQASVYGAERITVLCGPFKGTDYFNKIIWGPLTPKWIGSYEAELHHVVQEIIGTNYDVIVDLGAAEGYYAVGLARACSKARVISYDIDFIARRRQRELAALNGLSSRMAVRGRCDHAALDADLARGRCVVVSDIEGGEVDLIDPAKSPNLRRADVLVECHQTESQTVDDVARLIATRFSSTHKIEEICSRPRVPDEWSSQHPALQSISAERLAFATDEFRCAQKWLWMKAK